MTNKMEFIKIKSFYSGKDNIKKNEKTSHSLEKYLQKTYLIKEYYPKYNRNLKLWAKDLN